MKLVRFNGDNKQLEKDNSWDSKECDLFER
jgi:hypothetical protein